MRRYIILAIIVGLIIIFAISNSNGEKIYTFDEINKINLDNIDTILLKINLDNPNSMEIDKEDFGEIINVLNEREYVKAKDNKISLTEDGEEVNEFLCRITTLGKDGDWNIYIYSNAIIVNKAGHNGKIYEMIEKLKEEEIFLIQNIYG